MHRKIALFGNFGTGNLGNEATLRAMICNLRRLLPNAEIACVCPGPKAAASAHNISAVPIRATFPLRKTWRVFGKGKPAADGPKGVAADSHRSAQVGSRAWALLRACTWPAREAYRWFGAIAALRGTSLLVMTGTGMLGDYAIEPFGLHYDIFRWAIVARLCGCEVLFVSVGGGPIRKSLSRYFIRAALALAEYRSYRDAESRACLADIGASVGNDAVYPDLAFSLPSEPQAANDHGEHYRVIGVGVMNYHSRVGQVVAKDDVYHTYLGAVASVISRLLQRGYRVRILIGDVVWDQGVREDLRELLSKDGITGPEQGLLDEPAASVEELLAQLSSVDLVVSSRFHNLVLGLLLNKPVVAISYHEKFQPLMDGVGLGEFFQDIEQIDVTGLVDQVVRLHDCIAEKRPRIVRETKAYRVALDEQYRRVIASAQSSSEGRKSSLVAALCAAIYRRETLEGKVR